jgi:hypothetical protein
VRPKSLVEAKNAAVQVECDQVSPFDQPHYRRNRTPSAAKRELNLSAFIYSDTTQEMTLRVIWPSLLLEETLKKAACVPDQASTTEDSVNPSLNSDMASLHMTAEGEGL